MDLNDAPQQAEYREKVCNWLAEHDEAPPRQGSTEDAECIQARGAGRASSANNGTSKSPTRTGPGFTG